MWMNLVPSLCLAVGLLQGPALAQENRPSVRSPLQPLLGPEDTAADAVRSLFHDYKSALLEGDGATASRLVDQGTLEYFKQIKTLSLSGSEEEVRSRSFVDRLLIVTMRHELSVGELEEMDLENLLRHAVEAGWIGKQSIRQLELGEVEVEGATASALALTTGAQMPVAEAGAEPLRYRFVVEKGEWKFRFGSLVDNLNQIIAQLTAQLGTDEDALIFILVEQLSGRKVLPEVWEGSGVLESGLERDDDPRGRAGPD